MYQRFVFAAILACICQADGLKIVKGPALEMADERSTIVTWTTNIAGSSVVHYGTTPRNLNLTATSPNRWNKALPAIVHRVLIVGLQPATSYYYVVESGSVKSSVAQFITQPAARP